MVASVSSPSVPVGHELEAADEGGREVPRQPARQRLVEVVLGRPRVGGGGLLPPTASPTLVVRTMRALEKSASIPSGVLHPAAVEHLVEHLDDVGVRLLDLVEQHDAERRAADALGEHAAFAVADVAGGRALEPGDGVRLLVLGHVDGEDAAAEQDIGDGVRGLGLADPGGAAEHQRAHRPAAVGEAGEIGARLGGAARQRLVLADDALGERVLEALRGLADVREHAAARHAGQVRHHLGDVVLDHPRRRGVGAAGGVVAVGHSRPARRPSREPRSPCPGAAGRPCSAATATPPHRGRCRRRRRGGGRRAPARSPRRCAAIRRGRVPGCAPGATRRGEARVGLDVAPPIRASRRCRGRAPRRRRGRRAARPRPGPARRAGGGGRRPAGSSRPGRSP